MATTNPKSATKQPSLSKTSGAPQASSVTKPDNLTGCTDVPCKPRRKVTYVIKTVGSIEMPYAVAINGNVDSAFTKKPKLVKSNSGKIELTVFAGDKVALYLNSDAHPDRRTTPVYGITANEHDVSVTIQEKQGKHTEADTPVLQPAKAAPPTKEGAAKAPQIDEYAAPLTGDIWMKISHKYTEAEAKALIPGDVSSEVAAAVTAMYGGLISNQITIELPAKEAVAAKKLKVKFPHQNNPANNITAFSLLTDGVQRAHPAGYAVLFQAALDNEIDELTMNSCWRPLMGSIKHRAGLGLDVGYVGNIRLNREELINGTKIKPNDDDSDNVSVKERELFGTYSEAKETTEAALQASKKAVNALNDANAALLKAKAKLKAAKTDEQRALAEAEVTKATKAQEVAEAAGAKAKEAADAAKEEETQRKNAWTAEKNAREPAKVKAYRSALLRCACVSQLFDPWYVDINTHDKTAPLHNEQRGDAQSTERLHAHHLHITIDDPKLL
jgi:hypothetical protein